MESQKFSWVTFMLHNRSNLGLSGERLLIVYNTKGKKRNDNVKITVNLGRPIEE